MPVDLARLLLAVDVLGVPLRSPCAASATSCTTFGRCFVPELDEGSTCRRRAPALVMDSGCLRPLSIHTPVRRRPGRQRTRRVRRLRGHEDRPRDGAARCVVRDGDHRPRIVLPANDRTTRVPCGRLRRWRPHAQPASRRDRGLGERDTIETLALVETSSASSACSIRSSSDSGLKGILTLAGTAGELEEVAHEVALLLAHRDEAADATERPDPAYPAARS